MSIYMQISTKGNSKLVRGTGIELSSVRVNGVIQ